MIQINLYTFPNIEFGEDYKKTRTFLLYDENNLLSEIKSVLIKVFNPKNNELKTIKVVNSDEEILKVADYLFMVLTNTSEVKAQCNHTFITKLFGDDWLFINFFSDNILENKPFNLYD